MEFKKEWFQTWVPTSAGGNFMEIPPRMHLRQVGCDVCGFRAPVHPPTHTHNLPFPSNSRAKAGADLQKPMCCPRVRIPVLFVHHSIPSLGAKQKLSKYLLS